MGRHRNADTGVVVSVDDTKDERFTIGWESAEEPAPAPKDTKKKTAASKRSTTK